MKEKVIKVLEEALKKKNIKLTTEEIEKNLEIPPLLELGDYAFPCFFLSKKLKKNPNEIALEIKKEIKIPNVFEKIQTSGSYVNFFLDKKNLTKRIVNKILKEKENFGKTNIKGKIMIEFSQPNTHKAFHIGHIRGTVLGESLSRIHEFCNTKVIRANYSGDTGMHIAKWIWCYKKYHSKEKLRNDESWIASIYVDAVEKLDQNKELQNEINKINQKLETRKDEELNNLWKKTRELSIDSWKKIYKELNTFFDIYYFESEFEKRGKEISQKLLSQNIAKLSEGATIVDLKKYDLGVWVLLRKDGTVLYSSKDLALAERKLKQRVNRFIMIVADEQDLHFRQLFKTLELMNFPKLKDFKHLSFGVVRLPTGKMSSRTGENILYSDFIKEITGYAKKRIGQRSKIVNKMELEKKALSVSIAAIKYSMLKQDPNKIIVFNKKTALNFEGDTGPYLQYSYARACSILRKADKKNGEIKIENLEYKEIQLIKKLSEFPEIVLKSYNNLNPSYIANYSFQLAQIFNEFYHACPVIGSKHELFRLILVKSFKQVLRNSLSLLGIETLEKM
jgi:arginyl-tRNA synthetase